MKTKNTFVVVDLVTVIVLTLAQSTQAATWTQKADMPTARWILSTSIVGGKIYAIGGIGGSTKVEEYDPATDTWTQKADLPTGRVSLASGVIGGKIYAIGGVTAYWGGGVDLSTVEEYDPVTNTWTQKADMPTPREDLSTSVVDGKIYAIGGWLGGGPLSTVEEYDPTTDIWKTKADKPTASALLSTSVVNGKIYAFGGITNAWPSLSIVEEYDPATNKWTRKADMPAPRGALSTSVVNGKIYAFGGTARRGGAPQSTLFQYDPATDTWATEEDMPIRNLGMSTSVVGGRIYIIGGTSVPYPYNPPVSTVWEYDAGLGVPSPDFNGDGVINSTDVSILIDHWHTENALYDIAPLPFGDNFVDVQDLIFISEHLFEEMEDPALIAHWALDEAEGMTAHENVSGNDDYVIGGDLWQPAGGMVGGALELDGIDDCIISSTGINSADSPFSVVAWIKGGTPGQTIISQSVGVNWFMIDAEGKLMTELAGPGRNSGPLMSQTVITDGTWHRIGFVWDGSHRILFVDSVVAAEDEQSSLGVFGSGLYIGVGKDYASGTFFSGLIDDIRIYNRVVSP